MFPLPTKGCLMFAYRRVAAAAVTMWLGWCRQLGTGGSGFVSSVVVVVNEHLRGGYGGRAVATAVAVLLQFEMRSRKVNWKNDRKKNLSMCFVHARGRRL